MKREITLKNTKIQYELTQKDVKNINLRIYSDGRITVSASRWVKISVIEEFLISKQDFILNALDKYKNKEQKENIKYRTEEELKKLITDLCNQAYPYYEKYGIKYPEIKFRKMKTRWGSCHTIKGILTFNTQLIYAPIECVEYVVWHEFTHFLQANHSEKFYKELEKVYPNWRISRKKLKEISGLD